MQLISYLLDATRYHRRDREHVDESCEQCKEEEQGGGQLKGPSRHGICNEKCMAITWMVGFAVEETEQRGRPAAANPAAELACPLIV